MSSPRSSQVDPPRKKKKKKSDKHIANRVGEGVENSGGVYEVGAKGSNTLKISKKKSKGKVEKVNLTSSTNTTGSAQSLQTSYDHEADVEKGANKRDREEGGVVGEPATTPTLAPKKKKKKKMLDTTETVTPVATPATTPTPLVTSIPTPTTLPTSSGALPMVTASAPVSVSTVVTAPVLTDPLSSSHPISMTSGTPDKGKSPSAKRTRKPQAVCCRCGEAGKKGKAECSKCKRYFHAACMRPPKFRCPKAAIPWVCSECEQSRDKKAGADPTPGPGPEVQELSAPASPSITLSPKPTVPSSPGLSGETAALKWVARASGNATGSPQIQMKSKGKVSSSLGPDEAELLRAENDFLKGALEQGARNEGGGAGGALVYLHEANAALVKLVARGPLGSQALVPANDTGSGQAHSPAPAPVTNNKQQKNALENVISRDSNTTASPKNSKKPPVPIQALPQPPRSPHTVAPTKSKKPAVQPSTSPKKAAKVAIGSAVSASAAVATNSKPKVIPSVAEGQAPAKVTKAGGNAPSRPGEKDKRSSVAEALKAEEREGEESDSNSNSNSETTSSGEEEENDSESDSEGEEGDQEEEDEGGGKGKGKVGGSLGKKGVIVNGGQSSSDSSSDSSGSESESGSGTDDSSDSSDGSESEDSG